MSKVIVTGCCGLLGQKLVGALQKQSVVGLDLLDAFPDKNLKLDYSLVDQADLDQLNAATQQYRPEWIINCAGYTDVDGSEKNKALAYMVNTGSVENLVEICAAQKIKLVQLSTDYVFDGKDGPYAEEDRKNPLGYYGVTKSLAEDVIVQGLKDYIIVRTNVLYGTGVSVRPNFVTWVQKRLHEGRPLKVVKDQNNNPTLADNLADAIAELLDIKFSGIIHFGGADYLDRYQFAKTISEVFSYNASLILPALTDDLQQAAKRPSKGGLKIDKAKELLKTKPLTVKEGLEILKKQLQSIPINRH